MVTITASDGSTPREIGAKMVINESDEIDGTVGGGGVEHHARRLAIEALKIGQCKVVRFVLQEDAAFPEDKNTIVIGDCGGRVTLLIEPIVPQKEIVIFGGGHVAERLAKMCDALEQPYRIFDDRSEYASKERFPFAKEIIVAEWDHIDERASLTAQSFCVVMTYGHHHDEEVLEQLVRNPVIPYIGMIGSRHKVEARFANLTARGVAVDRRVFSPIGLGIGRNLPGDIALSILSEIQLIMHGGRLDHLRIVPEVRTA
jgi:xanthine dehydrogenase accessory factor